eukprot:CAMPEP_0114413702 /NCGR_PEP_ID=MMETSP0103-20121206/996_1 /TAXON_ID=37642 ORGANISM="Paraphysomonas imperforata, Strain PA2" /NCGR_SAMPLE_ID=MMETSP0103 /ASSEMBLY_ACC=CAM_ASM_000201 /LENGTH=43 /DNA_ID= /DNA_START= /DNA_END= /DNA_ORIENTATION=
MKIDGHVTEHEVHENSQQEEIETRQGHHRDNGGNAFCLAAGPH